LTRLKRSAPFSILYEDPGIIVVNKAPGIAVGADRWDPSRERLDKLLDAYTGEGSQVFTVHRIDRDASGLVVFARDRLAHKTLSAAFEFRTVQKRYIAVVNGRVSWKETACDLPLVPDGDKQHRTIIDKFRGKKSLTQFRLLIAAGNYSALEAFPETGRTHQIRVHLSSLGHPIVCDPLYGRSRGPTNPRGVFLSSLKPGWRGDPLAERPLLARLGLHAAEITLPRMPEEAPYPWAGLHIRAPLPRDMAALINQMEKLAAGIARAPTVEEEPGMVSIFP
jgi:RluA family pseudouridine synthase